MLEKSKQIQKAGDNSQQIQAGTIIVNQGITEERARAIFSEMVPHAIQSYTNEAYATANQRISKLEQSLITRLNEVEELLPAFADPGFQLLLRNAQRAAAATEREKDYAMLTELLISHVQKRNDRKKCTGIHMAVDIVDQIDDDALCGLTVVHVLTRFTPIANNIDKALGTFNSSFSKIVYSDLPAGVDWLDHLDLLKTIRINTISKFKKLHEYIPSEWDGIFCCGIKVDSESYAQAMHIIEENNLPKDILIENNLCPDYVRLPVLNFKGIDHISIRKHVLGCDIIFPLSSEQRKAAQRIWELYFQDQEQVSKVRELFAPQWDAYPVLKTIHQWWDSIPHHFQLSSAGVALAHANAQRCDNTIPDLN